MISKNARKRDAIIMSVIYMNITAMKRENFYAWIISIKNALNASDLSARIATKFSKERYESIYVVAACWKITLNHETLGFSSYFIFSGFIL